MKKDTTVNTFTVEEKKEIMQFLNDYTAINDDKNISEKGKLVLSFLLYTGSQQDGKFTIGYDYMSEVLGISKNGISAIVGRLESKGFFTRNKGVKGKNSEYVLNYETMKNYSPINTSTTKISTSSRSISTSKATCINPISTSCDQINTSSKKISTCTNINTTCTNYLADIQALREEINELIQVQKQLIQVQSELLNLYLNININNNINLKKHENINYNGNNMIDHEKNILKENEINFKVDHDKEISKDNENLNTSSDMTKDNENNSDENLNLSENEGITETEDEINSSSDVEETEDNETEISFFDESDSNTSKDNENFKVHFENGNFVVGGETENESISSEVEQDNENNTISESQDSDMKMDNEKLPSLPKNESISNTSKDMEKYNSNENFKVWGKIQPTYDYATDKLEEYRFTEYETLHARKDYTGKYTQVKCYIDIDADELKSFAIPSQGTFGILTRTDGKYSFIVADDYKTLANETETQNEISVKGGGEADGSTNKTTETQETSNNARTSVKTSEVEQLPTEQEKVAPVQSQIANTQCYEDVAYLTTGVSADEWDEITHNHGNTNNKKAWMNKVINFHGKQTTVSDALNIFHEKNKDGKEYMECNTFFYHFDAIMNEVQKYIDKGIITEEQKEDYEKVFVKLTKGKVNYWKAVFRHRSPRPNFPSEKRMWEMTGCIQVEETSNNAHTAVLKTQVDNHTTNTITNAPVQSQMANTQSFVMLPNLNDLYQLSYSDAVAELQKFVKNNPNISRKQKEEFNVNICSAFGIDGLYEF